MLKAALKVFPWLVLLLMSSCGNKRQQVDVVITPQEIKFNGIEITKEWKLETALGIAGKRYRQDIGIFYIYDELGLTFESKNNMFGVKEDTTLLAGIIFHFEPAEPGKPQPKKAFNGKMLIDGIAISNKFKKLDMHQFNSPWRVKPESNSLENSNFKMSIGSTTVYPPFRMNFHFNDKGLLRTISVENTN